LVDLELIEQQIGQLDQEIASMLRQHQDAVERLALVPGLGVDSAQQIIAEVGAKAATFVSANQPAEVLQPGKQPFNLPATAVASQSSQILGSVLPGAAMWRDELYTVLAEF